MSIEPSGLVFALGIVSALVGLAACAGKPGWAIALLIGGAVGQVVTQVLQYETIVSGKKEADRKTAFALYAFAEHKDPIMSKFADANPYIIGYGYFRSGSYSKARRLLQQSIDHRSFIAPSHYLLAIIATKEAKGDWSDARKELRAALDYDPKYAAAYYYRALLESENHQQADALADLKKATELDTIACYDVLDPKEETKWSEVTGNPQFSKIRSSCAAEWDKVNGSDATSYRVEQ